MHILTTTSKPGRRNFRRGLLFASLLLAISCGTPTTPCGTFAFTGTALPQGGGATINIGFNFGPSPCASTCNCNTICYVQVVRAIDRSTGAVLAPNSDQAARTVVDPLHPTLNGWAVDRLSERNWGYYGRNNDGTFAGTLTPGSNSSTATLRDQPAGWRADDWLDFVSVPVCIDNSSPCVSSLLGYEYWLIVVGPDGHNGDPFYEAGVDWNKDAFDAAVQMWNQTAPALGKTVFPAFTRMSN
jgi:hypothetical protein